MILAGLGADVVKVEDLDGGDYMRWMPPLRDGTSVMFTSLNRDKRSLRLDLRSAKGRQLFLDLVERFDVVLESFRPGVLDRLELGPAALHERNPRLVICSLSGFGQDGPDRLLAGHDLNYLARAGALSITGTADGRPVVPGVQIADIGGGSLGAVAAILAALRLRDRTGVGSHCDVSMVDGVLSWMAPHIAATLGGGAFGAARMLLNGGHPCYRVYRCADGWMSVAALEPKFWTRLCELLGVDDIAADAFTTGEEAERVAGRLESALLTGTRAHWREHLAGQDVCCEPVLDVDQVLGDAQVRHRADDVDGQLAWFPFHVGEHGHAPAGQAPAYGADSRALLAEVGVDDREFDRLVAQRVTA
jgi:crotonobetainyl-CoA:carnitine CoA-transferase CaiB-like acyl-CoA transferase